MKFLRFLETTIMVEKILGLIILVLYLTSSKVFCIFYRDYIWILLV